MHLQTKFICVSDYWQKRVYFQIFLPNNKSSYELEQLPKKLPKITSCSNNQAGQLKRKCYRRLVLNIDGISAFYFLRECRESAAFREKIINLPLIQQLDLIWLQIVPTQRDLIDYKWNQMLTHTLWEHIETDYLMSWLSTLGGGFSALGEQFSHCAETAGKISMKQLEIGMRVGDPFLQSRCKLYYSLSLIQTGRLRRAKYIVREQYQFARAHREQDGRLLKMVYGIWMRIQYEYRLRLERKLAAGDCKTETHN